MVAAVTARVASRMPVIDAALLDDGEATSNRKSSANVEEVPSSLSVLGHLCTTVELVDSSSAQPSAVSGLVASCIRKSTAARPGMACGNKATAGF